MAGKKGKGNELVPADNLTPAVSETDSVEVIQVYILQSIKDDAINAWNRGNAFALLKMKLGHGQFTKWVSDNTPLSQRTVQRYIRVAKELKLDEVAGLRKTDVYRLLAGEETGQQKKKAGLLAGKKGEVTKSLTGPKGESAGLPAAGDGDEVVVGAGGLTVHRPADEDDADVVQGAIDTLFDLSADEVAYYHAELVGLVAHLQSRLK